MTQAAERKVMVEQNLDRLMEEYDRIAEYTPGVLAQEVIPGTTMLSYTGAGLWGLVEDLLAGKDVFIPSITAPLHSSS